MKTSIPTNELYKGSGLYVVQETDEHGSTYFLWPEIPENFVWGVDATRITAEPDLAVAVFKDRNGKMLEERKLPFAVAAKLAMAVPLQLDRLLAMIPTT